MKNQLSKLEEKYFPHIPLILIIIFIVVILGLIILSISNLFDDRGILVNIATEITGILITILIVD
jgi:hypothetical protein